MQVFECVRLWQGEHQSRLTGRKRQHLEGYLGDQTQRAHGACHEPRHVVTRHILHDLAPEGEHLTLTVDELETQHVVAHTAYAGAGRTGQPAGHHTPDGGLAG
ncbi:MAG: hypothetical protein EBR58_14495, partial [Betaproteobacteria bacterium]|nr:hypothetical protein [Betaproteobacteria bacterium]